MHNGITLTRGSFISHKESVMLQGVAVSLMVWHHLFGFPERVAVPYVLVIDSFFHLETILSYFGRICIAVFAFCSGYGMEKKAIISGNTGMNGIPENYRCVIKHLLKFFSRFWLVFILFVPIGFLLNKYPVQPETIIKSFLVKVMHIMPNGGISATMSNSCFFFPFFPHWQKYWHVKHPFYIMPVCFWA